MYDLQLITIECSCPPILLYLHQQRIFFPNKHGLQSSVSHDCLVLLCRYLQVKKCWPRRFYRIAWWGITASDILWQTQRTSDVVLIINSRGKIHFPTIQKKSLKNSCLPRLLISIRAQALSGNIFWFEVLHNTLLIFLERNGFSRLNRRNFSWVMVHLICHLDHLLSDTASTPTGGVRFDYS